LDWQTGAGWHESPLRTGHFFRLAPDTGDDYGSFIFLTYFIHYFNSHGSCFAICQHQFCLQLAGMLKTKVLMWKMHSYICIKAKGALAPSISIAGQSTPVMVKTKRFTANVAECFIPSGCHPGDFFVFQSYIFL
jgi:hypothetical protein